MQLFYASHVLRSLAIGTALLVSAVATADLRAEDVSRGSAESQHAFGDGGALVYVDLAGLREGLDADSGFYNTWQRDALKLLESGSGVDLTKPVRGVWMVNDRRAVAVLEYPAPWDEAALLAQFDLTPTPDEQAKRLYHVPSAGTVLLFVGERTLVVGSNADAVADFQHATESQLEPRKLLADHGGARDAELFVQLRRPFPFDAPAESSEPSADADPIEAVASMVSQATFTLDQSNDVPLRLVLSTNSAEQGEKTAWFLGVLLANVERQYVAVDREKLLADDLVPDTTSLIETLDRVVLGARVEQHEADVEVTVTSPGGLPQLYQLALHELARTSLQARHQFESVSEQLNAPVEFEELQLEIEPTQVDP